MLILIKKKCYSQGVQSDINTVIFIIKNTLNDDNDDDVIML